MFGVPPDGGQDPGTLPVRRQDVVNTQLPSAIRRVAEAAASPEPRQKRQVSSRSGLHKRGSPNDNADDDDDYDDDYAADDDDDDGGGGDGDGDCDDGNSDDDGDDNDDEDEDDDDDEEDDDDHKGR